MRRVLSAIVLSGAAALQSGPALADSDHALGLSFGLGLAFPMQKNGQDVNGRGEGGFAEAEYIYRATEWITPRLYAGALLTSPKSDCGAGVVPCDVSARIVFLGGKFRVMAPIPWVGPFLELGLGASVGRLSTRSGQDVDLTSSGVTYHVPASLGLAIGSRHEFEISFQYLFHPAQKQVSGAAALGLVLNLG